MNSKNIDSQNSPPRITIASPTPHVSHNRMPDRVQSTYYEDEINLHPTPPIAHTGRSDACEDATPNTVQVYREWLNESNDNNNDGNSSGTEYQPRIPARQHTSNNTNTSGSFNTMKIRRFESLPRHSGSSYRRYAHLRSEITLQNEHRLLAQRYNDSSHSNLSTNLRRYHSHTDTDTLREPHRTHESVSGGSTSSWDASAQVSSVSLDSSTTAPYYTAIQGVGRNTGKSRIQHTADPSEFFQEEARQETAYELTEMGQLEQFNTAESSFADVQLDGDIGAPHGNQRFNFSNMTSHLSEKLERVKVWYSMFACFVVGFVSLSTPLTYTVYQEYYESTIITSGANDGNEIGVYPYTLKDIYRAYDVQPDVVHYYNSGTTLIVLIRALMVAVPLLFSLPVGVLSDYFEPRLLCLFGIIIVATSTLVSSFTDKLWALVIFQGALCGAGLSLVLIPVYLTPMRWFNIYQGLATGIAAAGAGTGAAALAPLYRSLLQSNGLSFTLQVQSLVIIVPGIIAASILASPVNNLKTDYSWRDIVWDIRMIVIVISGVLFTASRFGASYCLLAFVADKEIPGDWGTRLTYIMNAASVIGSVSLGLLSDLSGHVVWLGSSQILAGVAILALWIPAKSVALVIAFAVLYGIASGAISAIFSSCIVDIFGKERIGTNVGLVLCFSALPALIIIPAATSFIKYAKNSDSYIWLIALCGALSVIAGIISLSLLWIQKSRSHNPN